MTETAASVVHAEQLFGDLPASWKLRLPNGELLEDAVVAPPSYLKSLGGDWRSLWDAACARGSWGNEEIPTGDGSDPR